MRVKIIKSNKKYKAGQTVTVTPNEGFGLIDGGYATQSKDVVSNEWQTNKKVKKVKKEDNGKSNLYSVQKIIS